MTRFEIYTLILSLAAIVIIPLIVLLVRITQKWTRVEGKLETLANNMDKLVKDKDAIHTEMISQMRDDRKATDRRLRWLEEHLWKGSS